MEGYRNNVQQEHLDIDGLSNKALESYLLSTARRETMKIEIEKAELEEKAALNQIRNSSSRRKQGSSKDNQRPKRSSSKRQRDKENPPNAQEVNKKVEEDKEKLQSSDQPIVKKSENDSKSNTSDQNLQNENLIANDLSKLDSVTQNLTSVIIPQNLQNFDSIPSNYLNSGLITPNVPVLIVQSVQNSELINPISPNQLIQYLPNSSIFPTLPDLNSLPQNIPNSGPSIQNLDFQQNKENPLIPEVLNTSENPKDSENIDEPTFQLLPQDNSESEDVDAIDSELSPSPGEDNFSPEYSPSIDIIKIETELEELRKKIESLTSEHSSIKETIDSSKADLQELMHTLTVSSEKFQQEISTNVRLLDEEIKHLLLRNKQDKIDLTRQMTLYHSEQKTIILSIEKLDQQISSLNELLVSFSEIAKILYLMSAQEEEDRQSLQLLGYAESKSSKQYISLKADCMSCSGQNPVVMTAFKMACLNYSPSSIKYRHRTYSRKQLISVLGSIANSAWVQATSKAPRYATDFGSYHSIPTLSEDSTIIQPKRQRYNKSQFIELPSLNTSKLYLDINDTPKSTNREMKKNNF